MTSPFTPAPPAASRTAPKWARKRYVLPALGLAFFIGIGAGASDSQPKDDAKPLAARETPSATVTATVTASPTAKPEPAPTVTKTIEVKVKVTKTVTAQPASGYSSGDDESSSGGSVYYQNCAAARAAGAAPVHRGEPGYGSHLDRDGDGTGCDWG
ncbi:excalibur calcium-binding domain-containing protein [Streptomyces fungicidicus]|uniref:excalibur calcium-binding domain-containing protein n=1 Tax=Streptomyces fungicidicus TaxID=68203 RepID=UPI0036290C7F